MWTRFLKYNPRDPKWPNRDRFVLSAGHGSMLLYSMLHLGGYDVSLDDIKNFRQLGSITPGHPEAGLTPGVECTTGPLGQGFANGVGMAIASQVAAARFNSGERKLIDHYVYAIVSDGDLMEGIGSEAASIAGHLGLGNLIYLYDNNHITIEGDTGLAFSEDVAKRFDAYGWQTIEVDAHNHEQIAQAIEMGQADTLRPTLILCRSHIGFGSPNKQDTSSVHGEPLGNEELEATKKNLGWPSEPRFLAPTKCATSSQSARRLSCRRTKPGRQHSPRFARMMLNWPRSGTPCGTAPCPKTFTRSCWRPWATRKTPPGITAAR